jgi:adenine-specific DNA-methyltransferase
MLTIIRPRWLTLSVFCTLLKGKNIQRYCPLDSEIYIIYPHKRNAKGKTEPLDEDYFKKEFPITFNYLEQFKPELIEKKIKYNTNPKYWYSLHRSREINLFESDYIITPQLQNTPSFSINSNIFYADAGGYMINGLKGISPKSLLGLLNSKIMWFFIKNTSSEYRGGYFYFKTAYLEPFPLPMDIPKEIEMTLIKNVSDILLLKEDNSVVDTSELENQIDQMVYKLYGLTEEEISIIENN